MDKKKALVICSGTIDDYDYYKDLFIGSYIICADGGTRHMRKLGKVPDIIIGDLDSAVKDDLEYFNDLGVNIEKFNCEKDKTDTQLAVDRAIKMDFKDITIIGALGTRYDHSLANIFLLKYISDFQVKCKIINENNEIQLITDNLVLKSDRNWNLTLLPLTNEVTGINSDGLYYPLRNMTIKMGDSIGVSNKFVKNEILITIESGILIVIESRD